MEQNFGTMALERSEFERIETTLWKLVEALNEEVCPDEEQLLPLIVSHMLDSDRSIASYRENKGGIMKYDILIVGGGPPGIITALTAKSVYPEKSVTVIKDIGDSIIPCAIPYMIHTMSDPQQNIMGNMPLEKAGIEIIVDKVVSLDTKLSTVTLESGQTPSYERLVLATGSKPAEPPIPGIDKSGVFTIEKSLSAMTTLREEAHKARRML